MTEPVDPAEPVEEAEPSTSEAAEAAEAAETAEAPQTRRQRWLRSARLARWGLALAALSALAATAALLVVLDAGGPPRAAVGDVVDVAYSEDDLPHRAEVVVPWARLEVAAGDVREELPDLLNGGPNLRAPDGGRFVRVEASIAEDGLVPLAAVATPFTQETAVVLRADGRDYPVTGDGGLRLGPNETYDQGGSVWVAVDGDPEELEVLVSTDDVTQVVDAGDGSVDAGRAAGLADLPTQEDLQVQTDDARPCGSARPVGDDSLEVSAYQPVTCRVTISFRTPYVDGLGWAEDGREYLVAQVQVPTAAFEVTDPEAPDEFWIIDRSSVTARLAGEEALNRTDVDELAAGPLSFPLPDQTQAVFDVPAGEPVGDLEITVRLEASLAQGVGRDPRTAGRSWTVPGEVLS